MKDSFDSAFAPARGQARDEGYDFIAVKSRAHPAFVDVEITFGAFAFVVGDDESMT
jgi:hypothetical protein